MSAFTWYKLENLFRSNKIARPYKAARYQVLLAARLLMDGGALPRMNSHEMERRCAAMMKQIWRDADGLLLKAVDVVDRATNGDLNRDHIRTERVTEAILTRFGVGATRSTHDGI
jgi:hypothetical protein